MLRTRPIRCKIVVDNKEVKNFKYLGCEISYENEKHIKQKLAKLLKYWDF